MKPLAMLSKSSNPTSTQVEVMIPKEPITSPNPANNAIMSRRNFAPSGRGRRIGYSLFS
jgi:hypothetical protein